MKLLHLMLTAVLGANLTAYAAANPTVNPPVAQKQVKKAAGIWIDVRSAEEFNQGHLSGALNIPHTELAGKIAQISPNKNAPINLYCRSGRRAEAALQELKKLGYTNVSNHGGYQALLEQGLR